ncbi:MAG: hypothetical protein ACM3PP_01725 [Candidatus Saccharibacteria bacterium]
MTDQMVKSFYKDILNSVLDLESRKKRASETILLIKAPREKLPYIRDLLNYDLEKHRLLEQAAVAAMQNQSDEILTHLSKLYDVKAGIDVIDVIREEIARNERLLDPVNKEIKRPKSGTFTERRLLQEINKYAATQAREYIKVNF